jgi:nicotinate phosphoribosyltransferase
MKLSAAKITAPGRKQVWRGSAGDLLALADEPGPDGCEPLLETVMTDGRRVRPDPSLDEMRARFAADMEAAPTKAKRLSHPEHVRVRHSEALRALTDETRDEALERAGLTEPRGSD